MTEREAIMLMQTMTRAMTLGRPHKLLDVPGFPMELQPLAASLNRLSADTGECYGFAQAMAGGSLDACPPARANCLSAPLKELQSQLTSLCWSMGQLAQGRMVSKLHCPGGLFEAYNTLVEKESQALGGQSQEAPAWDGPANSWRYHQILSAINQLHIMVLEVSPDGQIVFANPPALEALDGMDRLPYDRPEPYEKEALIGYLCTFSQDRGDLERSELRSGRFPVLYELFDPDADSWYKITTDTVRLADGSMGLLHMIDDISERKRYERQLELSVMTDPLTGAYTRKAGAKKLEELFGQRFVYSNCVAFVDVDDLKVINDRHGHTEGDFALCTVTDVLMGCVRKADWVVRYGGDEFLVFFMDCDVRTAGDIVARMFQRMEAVNQQGGKPYHISFSAGLSLITEEMAEVSDLIQVIDRAMYQDKLRKKKYPVCTSCPTQG